MVSSPRVVLFVVLGLGLAAAVYWGLRKPITPQAPAATARVPAAAASRARAGAKAPGLPRIGLARLQPPATENNAGQRDIFAFGGRKRGSDQGPDDEEQIAVATPPPVLVPTPTPVPPLSVKYIGAVENRQGLKVAVLLTDRKEILTGQTGEIVGNRYKIVKIGLESVDIQEVGTEQVRRVPLRGN